MTLLVLHPGQPLMKVCAKMNQEFGDYSEKLLKVWLIFINRE